ncbi:MAG: ATP-dependent DNA helicase [Patescibacteria group bacterium]
MADPTAFTKAYRELNAAQKKAVDTVEGPVLVIAGPGTGKTHILTLRIANILQKTQATPGNILVLTFTDSAARTVRSRLGELVGEAVAREVFITTFHGFAEHLLSTYSDSFPEARGKRLAAEVETTLLWREVLEQEDLQALRTTKSPYFYLRDLARLRDDFVRERITLADYRVWLEGEAKRIRADESLYYLRDSKYGKKGDFKPEGEKKLERLEKGEEAARLISAYEALKEKNDVYDFADVLRIAVDGLKADADLMASVREQYQYLLADEHQDANELQHALLDTFALDDHPNLFVVGDEKQAIYRFQGADSTHFKRFTELYPRTELVYLTDSFRALQGLLDTSHTLIQSVPAATGKHQELTSTRTGSARMELLVAGDPLAERDAVAVMVEETLAKGVAPEEVAIIANRNATADLFAEHLRGKGIPVLRAGDVKLSSRPLMRSILALMRTISDPLDISALRETLLAPWWDLPLPERAGLLLKNRDRELFTTLITEYRDIAKILSKLQKDALSEAPLPLLSRAITESGARAYMLARAEHLEDVQLMRRIFMHIEEIVVRDPGRTFANVVSAFTKAHEHGLESVKTSITKKEGMVTVITAHKAKGMEFNTVFMVELTARAWERGGMSAKIPSPVDQSRSLEDVTKLFYVAMTRAKDNLILSYSSENGDGRETAPSALIPEGLTTVTREADPLPLLHHNVASAQVVTDLVRTYLTQEGLSPSALNEYLESPPVFFARRVLRLHEPETPATAIGTAVHAGIAEYLKSGSEDKAYSVLEGTLKRSLLPRNAAYERVVENSRARLETYLREGKKEETVAIEKAFSVKKLFSGVDVLLYGMIDAVFKEKGGECIVDFKTSSKIDKKDEAYPRQLAFYDLLLRENGHHPTMALIIQVSPEDVTNYLVPLTDESRKDLLTTLEEVVGELMGGAWRKGERKRDDSDAYDDLLALFD